MLEIKFNNREDKTPVTYLRKINDNVMLIRDVEANTSGFKTYIDDEQVGDFSEYTTIYRVKDNDVYFSNNGSIYENPKATIKINFNSDLDIPTEVKIILSTKEEVVITSPWTKEIEYIEGEYPFIESADDVINYDKFINGLSVDYIHKSNEPTWQETIEAQILYTALMTDTILEG